MIYIRFTASVYGNTTAHNWPTQPSVTWQGKFSLPVLKLCNLWPAVQLTAAAGENMLTPAEHRASRRFISRQLKEIRKTVLNYWNYTQNEGAHHLRPVE